MFVVTLPASAEKNPMAFAHRARRAGADILEIRTDLTPNVKKFRSPLPIVLAVRGKKGTRLTRELKAAYVDCDVRASTPGPSSGSEGSRERGKNPMSKFICSLHDYKATPSFSHCKLIVGRMLLCKPWAVKIATQVVTYKDLVILMKLQMWLREKKIRSIVLGMGDEAHLTRVLSPLNNVFTYASLDGFETSAKGQLPLSFYQQMKGRKKPAIFGIIGGQQITKSLSPLIHNTLYKKYKIDAVFTMFPTDNFQRTLKELEPLKIAGYCVTAPFKREAFKAASAIDARTKKLGVANTLVASGTGWRAFNTDVAGIVHGYPFLSECNSVAIVGAGGAAASVIEAIRMMNPRAQVSIFVRDPKKAKRFFVETKIFASLWESLQNFDSTKKCSRRQEGEGTSQKSPHARKQAKISRGVSAYVERNFGEAACPGVARRRRRDEAGGIFQRFLWIAHLDDLTRSSADAVICAITPDISLPLPGCQQSTINRQRLIAIDLRYVSITKFMKQAKQKGYRVYDGKAMLIHQALRQFEYFTGQSTKKSDVAYLLNIVRLTHPQPHS